MARIRWQDSASYQVCEKTDEEDQQHRHIHQPVRSGEVGLEVLDREQQAEVGGREHDTGETAGYGGACGTR